MSERIRNLGHDPHIDWVLILLFSTIVTAVLVANGFFSYLNTGAALSQAPVITPITLKTINAEMLRGVLEQFDVRARERAELIKSYKGPADPTL